MLSNEEAVSIIVMGIQGAGKGTQTDLIKEHLSSNFKNRLVHIEPGKKFREMLNSENYVSERISDLQSKGSLQPVFLPIFMWSSILMSQEDNNFNLVLDGSPRSLSEAEVLDSALGFFKREKVIVFHLVLPEEEAVNRLQKRGRHDDTPSAIKSRIEMYHKHTEPILDFFADNPRYSLIEIDGQRDILTINQDIISFL